METIFECITLCGVAGGIFLCAIYIEEQKSMYDREVLFTK